MSPFSSSRAKRITAGVVLIAWVFALASGVANACLLEARGTLRHVVGALTSHNDLASTAIGHNDVATGQDEDATVSKASCLKFCDDDSQSLIKQPSTADPGGLYFAIFVISGSIVPPVVIASLRADVLKSPPAGRSFRYRHPRLTL